MSGSVLSRFVSTIRTVPGPAAAPKEEAMPASTIPLLAMAAASMLLLGTVPSGAHERHQTPAAAAESSFAAPGRAETGAAGASAAPSNAPPYHIPPSGRMIAEHLHNKIVHFPLAFTVAAALLLALRRRDPDHESAARWLAWLAALGGISAYVTGLLQADAFVGEPKEWVLRVHRAWGTAAVVMIGLCALTSTWRPLRRFGWLFLIAAALVVLVAGLYGGVLAHGE